MFEHASWPLPGAARSSPLAAALSGFCLGPVGTAWSLNSRHALLTGAVYVGSVITWGGRGMWIGLLLTGLYGAAAVVGRNTWLDAKERAEERAEARAAAAALCRPPLVIDAVPVVVELEEAGALPPALPAAPGAALEVEPEAAPAPLPVEALHPVLVAELPAAVEPAAPIVEDSPQALPEVPAPVILPGTEPPAAPVPAPAAEAEPPPPPLPPAPRKRGRPKGSRKIAA